MKTMSPSDDRPASVPLDHDVWTIPDKYRRGWLGCFTTRAGRVQYVRKPDRVIQIFPTRSEASIAAYRAHLEHANNEKLNGERESPKGEVKQVVGKGRDKILVCKSRRFGKTIGLFGKVMGLSNGQ